MKTRTFVAVAGLLSCLHPHTLLSQEVVELQKYTDPEEVVFTKKSMSGPRLGFTLVPGKSELGERLDEEGLGGSSASSAGILNTG